MTREPFIAHSELTNEIYIVVGKEKYCVTEQAIKAVKAIKVLKSEEPSDDCVSRQAVLEKINDWWGITTTSGEPTLCDYIRELPPVTPARKVGKWIYHEKSISTGFKDMRECSCCRCYFRWEMPRNSYCPNCGAEMEREE